MFIRILAAGLAFITLYFTTGGEIMTQINQLPSYIGQLIESVAPAESAATPAPSDAAESATPTPVLSAEEELISLAKQLTQDEIDMLKRMIEVPEYDDLTLMQQLQRYSPYKNLKNLINKASEYGFQTYTALVSKIGNGLPDVMPDPVPLTSEEKNLIISQFLNQEGEYTNEKMLEKSIPRKNSKTAVFGVFEYIGEVGDPKTGPTFDLNLAKCETLLLFMESVGDHDYMVIGMTDSDRNRMVSIVEDYDSLYALMHSNYRISCIHSRNQNVGQDWVYDITVDKKQDYL